MQYPEKSKPISILKERKKIVLRCTKSKTYLCITNVKTLKLCILFPQIVNMKNILLVP